MEQTEIKSKSGQNQKDPHFEAIQFLSIGELGGV